MRTNVFRDVLARPNQIIWLVLAFQGGYMNAGGFIACHRFVSHVTGYGTYVGLEAGKHDYLAAVEMAFAPLFFLAGAAYAGWLVDRRLLMGREPKVQTGIVAMAALNLVLFLGEESGYLGQFGEPLIFQRDYVLLFCLCFACGLQNGLFSGLTSNQVRTTHLTGPTTDIGIALAKIYSLPAGHDDRRKFARQNWLRTRLVVAFSAGSMIAAMIFPTFGFDGFSVPCLTSLFLVWHVGKLLRAWEPEPTPAESDAIGGLPLESSNAASRG